jgi:dipeptidyl aminopeptidase/acylaminoacyl peptidase
VYSKATRTAPFLAFLFLAGFSLPAQAAEEPLLTVAEKSKYRATSRHADVVDFCKRLAKRSPLVRLGELGTSVEGRKLPLVILADPPLSTPEEAARSKKLVVFAMGNIHAGEVDGKEGLLMLARDLATAKERPLLKDLIIVFAPIFNADGNENITKTNRTRTQNGPADGVGVRTNAQGLDLNRDYVKLESPEVRALVRFFSKWDPALVVDTHTTNGSHHRYTITYDGPRNPAGDAGVIDYVRRTMLPDVGRRLEKRGGYKSFFYGNFSRDHKSWVMYPALPRFGTAYVGLRNRISVLSESYSYAPYKDRVLASRDFVRSCFEYVADNKDKIGKLLAEARANVVSAGRRPKARDTVPVRGKAAADPKKVTVRGFVEEVKEGRRIATDKPKDYEVTFLSRWVPELSVARPYAYLFSPAYTKVVENLQRHGIEVEELREDIELDLEVYRADKISTAPQPFQKHRLVTVQATARKATRRMPVRTILVRTGQPLGDLAVYLLEPQSDDGLFTWNFFDADLKDGKDLPVLRLPAAVPITSGRVRPLAEDRKRNRPVTYKAMYGARRRPANFNGSPVGVLGWFEDGEHFLQIKGGRLRKVRATTGRSVPFHDPAKLAKSLAALPAIPKKDAEEMARRVLFQMNPQRTGALFEYANDLYFCPLDGGKAVRLTKSPGREELPTFSPDGKFVAFVRNSNLYVVDIATQTERALTTDGNDLVSNGKADWVYFEEINNRNWKSFWWSPDSTRIAFLRFDDAPVHKFTVIDQLPIRQKVERTPYPKAGAANPLVKLGVVSVAGEAARFVDLGSYTPTSSLVPRAGWTPDSRQIYFYVQNRAQTWLDFCTASAEGGTPKRLFRETTKAWVNDPGPATYLKDGSFLLASERTGWRHLYHFSKEGKLIGPVTRGEWEARTLNAVDEKTGWVYFSGTRDSHIASNLYRVKLDGKDLQRLTTAPGNHRVQLSPRTNLFVDSRSTHASPIQVHLFRADGGLSRTLDTNPVYVLEEYRLAKQELVQIKTPDGFELEGSLMKPPDFDPKKRYPVWFMTYAGPHTPTIADDWFAGRVFDQVLASAGFVVFRCDPRSASGKGACSTWTAYRRLGVQELKDIEAAIGWLTKHDYIDKARLGMMGSSYGGFMTAYAMTHSKLFAAGVSGAPVTDWRNYDSIYTERYMNTPQENPEGYKVTSVVRAAKNLHGRLLIAHGNMDDNVHIQNTMQLIDELEKADKDFEMMVYPRSRHSFFGMHYQRLVYEFILRTLGQPKK